MINENAYYIGYYHNVRTLGAMPALVFDTIVGYIRQTGIGYVDNDTICELLNITERYLLPIIKKLINEGYIEKDPGNGRGNKSTYYLTKKGKQKAPFYDQKVEQNAPLYGQKVEQNAPLYGQKVEQNAPLYGQKVEQNAPLYGQKVEQSDNK
ncbi:MAG: winged helix-turn-helix transcriptional regulator, partial [Clostridia bacterium]|nr:winged helix-turn-helix transcriptional regulator [Clostridia bacterium]